MKQLEVSVVVPVGQRVDSLADLHAAYRRGLDECGMTYEMLYVLDGPKPAAREELLSLRRAGEPIKVIQLGKPFGEATALMVGFANSSGAKLVTLPAYFQIEPREVGKLLSALEGADFVVARRWPRRGGRLEALRRAGFHGLLKLITGESFNDLGCGARAMNRRVAEEITLYGEQHRLLPVLAAQQGFKVVELDAAQSDRDRFRGRYPVREYVHRVLDILTVFFLVRFTKKPLRFFGMIGSATFGVGALVVAALLVQRVAFAHPLADRPALLLACLFVVLGVQLFALGLLGELIIFTHAKDLKDYRVADVVDAGLARGRRTAQAGPAAQASPAAVQPSQAVQASQALQAIQAGLASQPNLTSKAGPTSQAGPAIEPGGAGPAGPGSQAGQDTARLLPDAVTR
ncbi:MAG TPA: glycosyltransferase [Gammaproteobacteria bacterium]|nr:glycosyltransferase [Gammaproteobacteria bacterium]